MLMRRISSRQFTYTATAIVLLLFLAFVLNTSRARKHVDLSRWLRVNSVKLGSYGRHSAFYPPATVFVDFQEDIPEEEDESMGDGLPFYALAESSSSTEAGPELEEEVSLKATLSLPPPAPPQSSLAPPSISSSPTDSTTPRKSKTTTLSLSTPRWKAAEVPDPSERYLAYAPHSGFHNQRIAFINALTLAKLLNRTLLVPPVILGDVVPWAQSANLRGMLEVAEKAPFRECETLGKNARETLEVSLFCDCLV